MATTSPLQHPDGVTFLHVSSESSDHYYYVLPGLPTDDEIADIVEKDAEECHEAGLRYIQHIERVPTNS